MNQKTFRKRLRDTGVSDDDITFIVNKKYKNESKVDFEASLPIELTPDQIEEIYELKISKDKSGLSKYMKSNNFDPKVVEFINSFTFSRDKNILNVSDTVGPNDLVYLILGLIQKNPNNLVPWFESGSDYKNQESFVKNAPWNVKGKEAKNKQIASLRPIDSRVKGPEPCRNPTCRSEYTYTIQKQTRAGDEMLTTKILCSVCSNSFTPSR